MKAKRKLPEGIVAEIRDAKYLRIRAGTQPHRFIGIWAVVVNGRVFVRSWSVKANGWYRTFLKEPQGLIQIGDHPVGIRALRTRSEQLKDAVDRAYLAKYNTPGSLKYARDLGSAKSRGTTLELLPL
jgi:hypothetical protein